MTRPNPKKVEPTKGSGGKFLSKIVASPQYMHEPLQSTYMWSAPSVKNALNQLNFISRERAWDQIGPTPFEEFQCALYFILAALMGCSDEYFQSGTRKNTAYRRSRFLLWFPWARPSVLRSRFFSLDMRFLNNKHLRPSLVHWCQPLWYEVHVHIDCSKQWRVWFPKNNYELIEDKEIKASCCMCSRDSRGKLLAILRCKIQSGTIHT